MFLSLVGNLIKTFSVSNKYNLGQGDAYTADVIQL